MGILGEGFQFGKELFNLGAKKVIANPVAAVKVGAGAATIAAITPKDIPVKPAEGPLSSLHKSPFDFTRLSYPITGLGEGQRYPHYITFYINARKQSKYLSNYRLDTQNRESVLQRNAANTNGLHQLSVEIAGTEINFKRKTTRTTQSIRLYMPDTLHWSFQNQYRDVNLTDALPLTRAGELGTDIFNAIRNGIKDGSNLSTILGNVLGSTAPNIAERVGETLGVERDLATSTLGYAINPNIDVIYGAPNLRSFVFDFMFAPRNSQEANEVLAIIRAFKFHAAPESKQDSVLGRYWIPPTEFDIEFSVGTMGKISTCVLETIDVDYAPNGWSAYTEDGARQDMPVNTRLQLVFKEMEYITKERVMEGF